MTFRASRAASWCSVGFLGGCLLAVFVGYPFFINYLENHTERVGWSQSGHEDRVYAVTISRVTGITSYERYLSSVPSRGESIHIESGFYKSRQNGSGLSIEYSTQCSCVEDVSIYSQGGKRHRWELMDDGKVYVEESWYGSGLIEPYEKHKEVFERALEVRNEFEKKYSSIIQKALQEHHVREEQESRKSETKEPLQVFENWLEKNM